MVACFFPVTVWRSKSVNPSGKRSLVFTEAKGVPGSKMQIPCGQCNGCRADLSEQWMLRLMHEMKYHECASFLTVTYNEQHVPFHGQLVPLDIVKYIRALRNHYGKRLRYYLCGEYGDKNGRPHYHVILFGHDFSEDRRKHSESHGHTMYTSETASRLWGKGFVIIGDVTAESCGYVARYCMKKFNGQLADIKYQRVDEKTGEIYMLQKEFARMSNRPGIGRLFYEDNKDGNLFIRDSVISRGRERKIPKSYDKLMDAENPELMERVKAKRVKKAKSRADDNTPERLRVRHEVFTARMRQLKRDL